MKYYSIIGFGRCTIATSHALPKASEAPAPEISPHQKIAFKPVGLEKFVMKTEIMFVLQLMLSVFMLLLLSYAFHKIRKAHLKTFAIESEIQSLSANMPIAIVRNTQAICNLNSMNLVRHGIPLGDSWSALPEFLFYICQHSLLRKPNVTFECGSGISTVMLASCVKANKNGHIYSFEHDPNFAKKTRNMLSEYGLRSFATVIDAPLTQISLKYNSWLWYSLDHIPDIDNIDMIVIDGPPMPLGPLIRYPAGPVLFPRLSPHGQVFLDDAKRDDETTILKLWKDEFAGMNMDILPATKGCANLYFGEKAKSGQ
ncbi:MAG: class I SAM-dependent methyltransferase [Rhodospirillales bacterium]|nr:MAG: class I SAM-dependent methyltransferase [Rhodospirillales bacterium]